MNWKETIKVSKTIAEKFSYNDWIRLLWAMDYAFETKKREHERQLTLSPEDVDKAIRSRFGQRRG